MSNTILVTRDRKMHRLSFPPEWSSSTWWWPAWSCLRTSAPATPPSSLWSLRQNLLRPSLGWSRQALQLELKQGQPTAPCSQWVEWEGRALTTHVYFQPLQGELTERLAKDVKDGGRFDWEKDLPSAIERMLHGKSEEYAFMAAIQAMYGETRKPQFSIKIRVSICLSQRLSGGRVLSLRQELVTKSRARQGSYSSFYDGQ